MTALATETHVQPIHLESITVSADCAVLRIAGEVDVYTAPQLRECVIRLLADGVRHVIADLREVAFLDSAGLGALVGSHSSRRNPAFAVARGAWPSNMPLRDSQQGTAGEGRGRNRGSPGDRERLPG